MLIPRNFFNNIGKCLEQHGAMSSLRAYLLSSKEVMSAWMRVCWLGWSRVLHPHILIYFVYLVSKPPLHQGRWQLFMVEILRIYSPLLPPFLQALSSDTRQNHPHQGPWIKRYIILYSHQLHWQWRPRRYRMMWWQSDVRMGWPPHSLIDWGLSLAPTSFEISAKHGRMKGERYWYVIY